MSSALALREEAVGTFNDATRVRLLEQKWDPYLKGIKSAHTRRTLAILAENQLNHFKRLSEDTNSADVGSYTKYIFPVLRRVVVNLIAPSIVSVQPMMAPVGGIFVREAKYATTKGGITAGANVFDTFDEEYSSERISGELLATGDGTNYGGAGAALQTQLGFFPVRPYDTTNGFSVVIAVYNGSTAGETVTDNGSGTFAGDGTGTINYATGAVSNLLFTTAPALNRTIKATYQYNMELNQRTPEINLEVTLTPIVARPRKLKGTWSPEANEDFRALQGLDAESDLTDTMAKEMGLEIDREVIADLTAYAVQGTQTTYDRAVLATDTNEMDAIRRILTPMTEVSNRIWKKTKRGTANFAVTSTEVMSTISQLATHGDFQPALNVNNLMGGDPNASILVPQSYSNTTSNFGIRNVGVLNNRWNIHVDPLFTATKILMGLKGDSYLDSGYVLSPYVMFMMTPTFYDPKDFSFRKGIRSRYAKSRLRPEWYGLITCSNLPLA